MKSFAFLLSLLLLVSCNQSVKDEQDKTVAFKDTIPSTNDSLFRVNHIPLLVQIKRDNERVYSLRTLDGSFIIKPADYYSNIEILDINKDGFDDIRIFIFSNTGDQCKNFFFDPKTQKFKVIENSDLAFRLVPNTNLYYSYSKAGCADKNWESHLSKIENFEEIHIGRIEVHDCNDKSDGIVFYKIVTADKVIKIDQKPVPNFEIEGKNNKWSFIEKYWINNYEKYQ